MYKYVKFDKKSGICTEVGNGTNTEFYKSIGMVEKDVEQSEVDGQWYLSDKCPHYSDDKKLEKAKTEKLSELTSVCHNFDDKLVNNDMYVISSLGFKVNADLRSQNNLRGLIAVGVEPVNFMTADNSVKSLTLEQLNVLLSECAQNGQHLYILKWRYREQIEQAKTVKELNAIEFKFTMKDFS